MLDDLTAGQVLGRYELLLPIAKGGMASVWAARMRGTRGFQKMVAVKTMLPGLVDDLHFERMFLDEASLASQVRHPHVIEILDLGEVDRILYLVMEWVDGEPLNIIMKYAATRGGIPLAIAVSITAQTCRGLHAAHELRDESGTLVGLVHRDVSPQNVLLTYEGVVKVVDFGVAKATSRVSHETEAGQLKGKIAYMSPEQLRGERIDRRTDVFAVGILLYMMTTGTHPFRGDDQAQTIKRISSDEPVTAPSAIVPGYPAGLEAVVMQALAKDASKRYPTANDMLIGLTRALPQSMRPSTDEEVAEFLRALLPDRLEKRKAAIKAALDAADRRKAGKSVPRIEGGEVPDEAPTVLEGLVSSREMTPSAEGQQSLPGATSREAMPIVRDSRAPPRRSTLRTILSAGAVAAVGAIVALLLSRRPGPPANAGASAAPSSVLTVTREPLPPPVDLPTVDPVEALPPAPSESVAPAKPPATPVVHRRVIRRAEPAPSAKPQPSNGTFVSPIRNPGF
ncbi:MAG TPA: protein kinase [Polyangiaceae bacterium]|jgi:serine/threonine-protein kinase|nr:protein kinase [Polyangiaceae bacterium]